MAQPSFHRARVEEFAPIFARVAEALGDRWERAAAKGQSLDVAADMMLVALQAVVEALFSEKIGDEADALAKATLEVLHHIMAEARMMGMVASHPYLFVSGKMEVEELGEFCCSSRPVRETVDANRAKQ